MVNYVPLGIYKHYVGIEIPGFDMASRIYLTHWVKMYLMLSSIFHTLCQFLRFHQTSCIFLDSILQSYNTLLSDLSAYNKYAK
jgi:hypothetical protein